MVRPTSLVLAVFAFALPAVTPGATSQVPPARVAPKAPAPPAHVVLSAPSLVPAAQAAAAEPTIHAIHGRTVSIAVPAGFTSINLQVLTAPPKVKSAPGVKPPGPEWKTVVSKPVSRQASLVPVVIPKLTSLRNLRVLGVKYEPVSLANLTAFPADPEENQGGDARLSLSGGSNLSLAQGSTASITSTTSSSTSATMTRSVTESDIWKIDGDRLYYYNSLRGLQVFDVAQPDRPILRGTLPMPGAGEEMYLLDPNHVVLLRNENFWWSWIDWDARWDLRGGLILNTGNVAFTNNATLTLTASTLAVQSAVSILRFNPVNQKHSVVVVDVSSGVPATLAEVPFTGSFRESRLVGDVLYVASNGYEEGTNSWGTRLTSFDLADPAHPILRASLFVSGWTGPVMATNQYFFLTTNWGYPAQVHAFDISDPRGAIVEAGQVSVPGVVADKFKIDQRGTILTVVSSGWRTDASTGWGAFSLVSTFSLADPQNPVPLGTLEGPVGEQLFATRFDGSRLYMVTAVRSWDPLFIIDLSKPEKPTILGEVEMPGVSTFIQPLGDRLVATGLVNGQPTVDLYDVSNAAAPRLASRVSVGGPGQYVYSEATWNEKAFNVLPESNLILMPFSTYSSADNALGGVQLVDLLPDRLVKRGTLLHKFYPRRAGLHGNRILSISGDALLTVNAEDRDHPVVTSDVEIAWPVEHTFLAGPWLLELGGNVWSITPPTLTVTPAGSPDVTTTTLALPNLNIFAATLRDHVLYVLQGEYEYSSVIPASGQEAQGTSLTLSAIDVSKLPATKLLGQTSATRVSVNYLYSGNVKPLWVNDRTLLFTQNSTVYGWPNYYLANSALLTNGVTATNTASLATTSNVTINASLQVSVYQPWFWYSWNTTTELFAFDVSKPAQPKYASRLRFARDEAWDVSPALTADDKVYLSYKVLPWYLTFSPDGPNLINRHFMKVIDYSDSAAPVVPERAISLPGQLRALGRQGSLLYTEGPMLTPECKAKQYERAVQASSFDGTHVRLLDQLSRDISSQPFVVSGDAVLLLHPQPATFWNWDSTTNSYAANPAHTTLDTWTLGDDNKFIQGVTLTLDHELSLGLVNNLGVLRTNDASVRLLNLSDPLHPTDLGAFPIHANGSSSLSNADGDAQRGLWLPLGPYGVDVIPLAK